MSKTLDRESSIDNVRRDRRPPRRTAQANPPSATSEGAAAELASWITPAAEEANAPAASVSSEVNYASAETTEEDAAEAIPAYEVEPSIDLEQGAEALDQLDARINDFNTRIDTLQGALRNRLASPPDSASRTNPSSPWGVLALAAVGVAFAIVAVPYVMDTAIPPGPESADVSPVRTYVAMPSTAAPASLATIPMAVSTPPIAPEPPPIVTAAVPAAPPSPVVPAAAVAAPLPPVAPEPAMADPVLLEPVIHATEPPPAALAPEPARARPNLPRPVPDAVLEQSSATDVPADTRPVSVRRMRRAMFPVAPEPEVEEPLSPKEAPPLFRATRF